MKTLARATALLLAAVLAALAQNAPGGGAVELRHTLDRLNVLGSALMLGAHPDDENTAVIAYLARGRHYRTAYLSANRGEGGQNLIGAEQGVLMGVIRTQELLAARALDGGEQFFTRVIDFGYSKSPEEALAKWGRDVLLGDMTRVIRRFRPDVVIARFPPPPGDGGHGQHTAVGHLGPEAFEAAADADRYPEQLREGLEPWRAKRYYWNVFQFGRARDREEPPQPDRLSLDVGDYDPLLGRSYAEIAGESRSMHRSQSMGAPQPKGAVPALFDYVAGERASGDLFEGIDTTWGRVAGGETVGKLLAEARDSYDPTRPAGILPTLLKAYLELAKLKGYWPDVKREELKRAIELASGAWLDAAAERWNAVPGGEIEVELTVVNRSATKIRWVETRIDGAVARSLPGAAEPLEYNRPARREARLAIPSSAPYSRPHWLDPWPRGDVYLIDDPKLIGPPQSPAVLRATFELEFEGGVRVPFEKEVAYRWVDRARGERTRRLQVVPEVVVGFTAENMIFPSPEPRRAAVRLRSNVERARGKASLTAPKGWTISPASRDVEFSREGQEALVEFEVSPPAEAASGELTAVFDLGGKRISTGTRIIEYDHIPVQVVYPEARLRVERFDVRLLSKNIGYVMGAGDNVPEALEAMGARVTLLGPGELAAAELDRFDAIVTGVRALNTRSDLLAARERLLDYVKRGGTLVTQYNTISFRSFEGEQPPTLAPYPLTPFAASRQRDDRVTHEEAPVTILLPDHPLLNAPNRITAADFEGWAQERGLYFMKEWDPRYQALWESADPGQEPQAGGMLVAPYGQGVYVFTAYAWFRQLPAGVPGAYRIFANLVSAGKRP